VLGGAAVLEILLLRVDERPRFVKLEAGHLEVAHLGVMQPVAGFANLFRQAHDRCPMHVGEASSRPRGW